MSVTVIAGWSLGLAMCSVVRGPSSFGRSLRHLCRVSSWIPLIAFWPLIFWLQQTTKVSLFLLAVTIGIVAVTLCVMYQRLLARSALDSDNTTSLIFVTRAAIVHGLLVSLIIHLGLHSHYWFSLPPGSANAQYGYVAAGALAILLIVIDTLLFQRRADLIKNGRQVLMYDLKDLEQTDLFNSIVTGSAIGIILTLLIFLGDGITTPMLVVLRLKDVILGAPVIGELGGSIWRHLCVSLLAIVLGTIIASCIAALSELFCRKILNVQVVICRIFGLTYVMTILVPCFLLAYRTSTADIWFSVEVIALILFFPFFETFLSFNECTWFCRFLLALDKGLGYGFVGMLLSESIHSSEGVGLAITIATATQQLVNGVAIVTFVLAVFVILAQTIRWLLRRECVI